MSVGEATEAPARSQIPSQNWLPLGFRLAWRDLRGGIAGFRVFLACLALGVGAIAAVLSISRALEEGASAEGRDLLGGDLSFSVVHRKANDTELAFFQGMGGHISTSATLRSMARSVDGTPGLVELKAADNAYPLYGEVSLEPAQDLSSAIAQIDGVHGVVVEEALLARLGIEVGNRVSIGEAEFEVRATIKKEPDRLSSGFNFGPRALVSLAGLDATQLVKPGSLLRWHYKLALPEGTLDEKVRALAQSVDEEFPVAGWRTRSRDRASPGVSRFTDRVTLFLSLLGLTALLVGGVGVANATKAYLDGKARTIAMLKCVGATSSTIFTIYLTEILILALLGITIGVVVGGGLPLLVGALVGNLFPIPAHFALYPAPLLFAAAAGLLTAFAFSLWPLGRAQDIPPGALFRDLVAPTGRMPRASIIVMAIVALAILAALIIATAHNQRIAAIYVGGAIAAFVLLALLGRGLMWLISILPHPRVPEIRIGLANLHRPGAATPGIVLSLGLGLTLLVMVGSIEANLQHQLADEMPDKAPSFFFLDIRKDQLGEFRQVIDATATTENLKTVPLMRGRLVKVKGINAADFKANGEGWVLRGDRGITYSGKIPEGSEVVTGEWWAEDYKGPQLVSVTDEVAEAFDLTVGDTLTFNILGRDIKATIANSRNIDWRSLSINFVFIFSPGLIESAPHANLATVEMDDSAEGPLLKSVVTQFPNITAVSVKDAIEAVGELVGKLMIAIRAGGAMAVLAGALVLGGAIAAGRQTRIYDAVVLKTFGATRKRLLMAYIVEFGTLGLVTSLFAAFAGSAAAYLVLTQAMETNFTVMPGVILQTLAIGIFATLAAGFLGTWRALGHKAADVLRSP